MTTGEDLWWPYLHFHIPNYVLAALFYTCWGRFLMSFFLPPDSENYIFRWFRRLTDWLMAPVAYITPSFVPAFFLPPVAAFWIAVSRVAFFFVMFQLGQTPIIGRGGA